MICSSRTVYFSSGSPLGLPGGIISCYKWSRKLVTQTFFKNMVTCIILWLESLLPWCYCARVPQPWRHWEQTRVAVEQCLSEHKPRELERYRTVNNRQWFSVVVPFDQSWLFTEEPCFSGLLFSPVLLVRSTTKPCDTCRLVEHALSGHLQEQPPGFCLSHPLSVNLFPHFTFGSSFLALFFFFYLLTECLDLLPSIN